MTEHQASVAEHQASRTLLKSPPELWTECSDAQSLARHLTQLCGEVRITRLEPERTVAWEGERASGTVTLEPSGWGTRVTLTARTERSEPAPAPSVAHSAPSAGRGLRERMRRWLAREPAGSPQPAVDDSSRAAVEPAPSASAPSEPAAALNAALDSLGSAHHRPFSRA